MSNNRDLEVPRVLEITSENWFRRVAINCKPYKTAIHVMRDGLHLIGWLVIIGYYYWSLLCTQWDLEIESLLATLTKRLRLFSLDLSSDNRVLPYITLPSLLIILINQYIYLPALYKKCAWIWIMLSLIAYVCNKV